MDDNTYLWNNLSANTSDAISRYLRLQQLWAHPCGVSCNPYFTAFSNFPHDPFYRLDDWKHTPSAYGPIWLMVSAVVAFLCGNQPIVSLITYQALGLTFHLLNTLLVIAILRAQKRSERIVAVGALLYAWNPLLLLESSLNGTTTFL